MESKMLVADIEALIDSIDNAMDEGNSKAKDVIYNAYDSIVQNLDNNYVKKNIINRAQYLEFENSGGSKNSYGSILLSLKQIKERLLIYNKKESVILVKPYFKEIKKVIIDEIKSAKYIIWAAVAWFTDQMIYDELIKAKEKGINVQIIMLDDERNKKPDGSYKLNFQNILEVKYTSAYGNTSISMHHKFCIIDLEKVITGSYNWTYPAEKNNENVSVIYDAETAKKYSTEFIEMKNQ